MTDLGSSNGTWVNGERIWVARRLRHGDEIRVGQTRLVFRDPLTAAGAATEVEQESPALTVRERDVLVALCRPLLARDMFTEPASTRVIADELVITQAAVKQHLGNLYDKFGVAPGDDHRRARLANEALRRGAVSLTELRGVKMRSKARRTLVGIAAAVMIAAPSAQAMTIDGVQHGPPAHMAPSSSVAPGLEYQDLRRDLRTSSLAGTTSPRPAIQPAPASGGFDWPAATIGAVLAAGLALASWTALGLRRTARA